MLKRTALQATRLTDYQQGINRMEHNLHKYGGEEQIGDSALLLPMLHLHAGDTRAGDWTWFTSLIYVAFFTEK